jgi:hypothetical protein
LFGADGIVGVVASPVTDPAVVEATVARVAALAAGAGTTSTREVGGATVNVVETTQSGLPLRIEYGVVDGYLVIGLGSGLEQFVTGPGESLAASPTYQTVMAELPAEHGGSFYLDLSQVIGLAQLFLGIGSSTSFQDASPDCGNYESQAAAQAAFEADEEGLIDLDQNFDGEACEDYFDGAPDFSALRALASVQFERDGLRGSSTILYITE